MPRKLPQLRQLIGKPVTTVDIATFAALLHASNNRFIRVIWESNQNKRLKKTGPGAEYKTKDVTKLYVCTVRNNYKFENAVKAELERQGNGQLADGWQAKERTWGTHIPHTPFVVHQADGEPKRLHGHFLPADTPNRKAYHNIEGETGYYVDGVKADDALLKSLEYAKKEKTDALDIARQAVHPVNTRLDDVLYFKVAGKWYRLKETTEEEINKLSEAAEEFGQKMEAA